MKASREGRWVVSGPATPEPAPRAIGPRQASLIELGLRTVGRLSPEIRMALRHGFASGVAVERVYANPPRQRGTHIGRWLDRLYLRAPANAALRARQAAVQEAVKQIAATLADRVEVLRLFDPAAGAGRTGITQMRLEQSNGSPARAVLGDHAPSAREAAQAAADRAGVNDRVAVVHTDAFDPASLRTGAQGLAPNLVVVAGLYELQPDDAAVQRSLATLAELSTPPSWLVLTGMNTHPQAALVERLSGVSPPPGRTVEALGALAGRYGFRETRRLAGVRGVFDVAVFERRG